ncbi:uncharacterized protein LOC109863818 [Pseudomyrmex gracilis]|uniref:uncharacterized protein LOC109863818 n=1 Tax=Pseudomyrmex gracilis TaxID=219809 RepID=UPI000995B43E|nr:uncharacterized protein LOC109863818 [Pseudomyrmex gracilis]
MALSRSYALTTTISATCFQPNYRTSTHSGLIAFSGSRTYVQKSCGSDFGRDDEDKNSLSVYFATCKACAERWVFFARFSPARARKRISEFKAFGGAFQANICRPSSATIIRTADAPPRTALPGESC